MEKAFHWFNTAAREKHPDALFQTGRCYLRGRGVPYNAKMAFTFFLHSASCGNNRAQYRAGLCFYFGTGTFTNVENAMSMFRFAALHGHGRAQYNLGVLLQRSGSDASEYVEWYKKSASKNIPEAQYRLGLCYATGKGVHKHHAKAVRLYRRAADSGYDKRRINLIRRLIQDVVDDVGEVE
jgi:TPR repeat protein